MQLIADYSIQAALDPAFTPAVLWMKEYEKLCQSQKSERLDLQLMCEDGSGSRYSMEILSDREDPELVGMAHYALERTIKFLGISMGTGLAAGYVDGDGNIGTWLNELAFCPIDYQEDGHLPDDTLKCHGQAIAAASLSKF